MDIEKYRKLYPRGTKICLSKDIDDPYTPKKAGEICEVEHVDDIGNVHVRWESGGGMALVIGVDEFEKV